MATRRPIKVKVYARAITAIALIIVWSLSAFSGLILWLAPEVRQAGNRYCLVLSSRNGGRYTSGFVSLSWL